MCLKQIWLILFSNITTFINFLFFANFIMIALLHITINTDVLKFINELCIGVTTYI